MGRVVGVLQQAKGLPDARPGLVVDENGRVWRWVEHAAGLTGAGWVEVDTYVPRESGGSLPDEMEEQAQKFGRALAVLGLDSPVLNKSGGSDVCVCGHEAGRHGDNTCGGPHGNCACDHYQPAAGPAPRVKGKRT